MKKSLIFASVACAGVLALHADTTGFTLYKDWFTGIGANAASTNEMDASGGSWAFAVTTGDVTYQNGLVFDLDSTESVAFNVTDPGADTNTWTDVKVSGVFTPVSTNDLPSNAVMGERNAQVGFVVGVSDEPATNYYAWVAGGDWVKLIGSPDPSGNTAETETTLLVTFDYTVANAAKVRFAILTGTNPVATNFLNSSGDTWLSLTTAQRKVNGVSCYGSGKITAADGAVGLAVAEMDSKKYGSLSDAVAAASTSEKTIDVLRATSENVTLPSGSHITLNDPDANIQGTVTVPAETTVKVEATTAQLNPATNGVYSIPLKTSGGTVQVELPDAVKQYKQAVTTVDGNNVIVSLVTKDEIIANVAGGGKALTADAAELRKFLDKNVNAAYSAAQANATDISAALEQNGSNGIKLWQSYVMGADPTAESVKPVAPPAGDADVSNIKLAIPSIDKTKLSGDFYVQYGVYKNNTLVGSLVDDPASLVIPLSGDPTAQYTIKAVLTSPVAP